MWFLKQFQGLLLQAKTFWKHLKRSLLRIEIWNYKSSPSGLKSKFILSWHHCYAKLSWMWILAKFLVFYQIFKVILDQVSSLIKWVLFFLHIKIEFHSEGTIPEILSISCEYYFCNFCSKNVYFKHMFTLWDETGNKCVLSCPHSMQHLWHPLHSLKQIFLSAFLQNFFFLRTIDKVMCLHTWRSPAV